MACCTSEQLSLITRALSDPIRYQILDLIAQSDTEDPIQCCKIGMCVCDIQEALDLSNQGLISP